jgi:hypothetical protein
MRKLKPVLSCEWRLIGKNPDLNGLLPGNEDHLRKWEESGKKGEFNSAVDHHLFRGPDGNFHLWGCVRATAVGRILYHWETGDIMKTPWRETGEFIRCDRSAGECIDDWEGQEWLQSPFFIKEGDKYYMFYGGHSTDRTISGKEIPGDIQGAERKNKTACQMCLMTSEDGRHWTRYKNGQGLSRIFAGPGEVRDPCLIKIKDEWFCYYTGFRNEDQSQPAFFVRRSKDLVNWSDYKVVFQDTKCRNGFWHSECPHVVFREGFYYLFRTEDYYLKKTHVYRSRDPMDFGIGDLSGTYVCDFPAAAVEIHRIGGQEYVTSSHDPGTGEFMAGLSWVNDR